jgi:hypothetical protein
VGDPGIWALALTMFCTNPRPCNLLRLGVRSFWADGLLKAGDATVTGICGDNDEVGFGWIGRAREGGGIACWDGVADGVESVRSRRGMATGSLVGERDRSVTRDGVQLLVWEPLNAVCGSRRGALVVLARPPIF